MRYGSENEVTQIVDGSTNVTYYVRENVRVRDFNSARPVHKWRAQPCPHARRRILGAIIARAASCATCFCGSLASLRPTRPRFMCRGLPKVWLVWRATEKKWERGPLLLRVKQMVR